MYKILNLGSEIKTRHVSVVVFCSMRQPIKYREREREREREKEREKERERDVAYLFITFLLQGANFLRSLSQKS